IESDTVSVAQAVSCADWFMSIFGRSKIENQRPFRAGDSQRLPRWPRPAVCSSANRTRPSFESRAISKTASLVEPVCSSTIISRPMMLRRSFACSSSAARQSKVSTGDMRHFQVDVDCARGMRQSANRNAIHASGRDAVHVFQSDPAARFEFDVSFSESDSLANLGRRHIVEQDDIDTLNFDKGTDLFQIIGLHFDTDVWPLLAKLANSIGEAGKSLESCQMVVFHEHHVVQTEPVILSAAVVGGGGENHRFGLYDMVLVKDNHLATFEGLSSLADRGRQPRQERPNVRIEVEANDLEQVRAFVEIEGIDVILLDNMTTAQIREAVALRKGNIKFEASGGITLKNVNRIAATGVDCISVGRLTHAARAIDIDLEMTHVPS